MKSRKFFLPVDASAGAAASSLTSVFSSFLPKPGMAPKMEARLREALRLLRALTSFFSSLGSTAATAATGAAASSPDSVLSSALGSTLASVDFFGATAAITTGLLRELWVFL